MYATRNFKTKKALKEALTNGDRITVYQPGYFSNDAPTNGKTFLEGPHYPEPHKWYAEAWVENDIIVKVK